MIAVELIVIDRIRRDGGTQCRASLSEDTIRKYQALMDSGVEFPPIRVWSDGENYWLADGFQRITAAERLGRTQIAAEVRLGSHADAQWDSYGCNATHGLPRTVVDIKRAAACALMHPNSANLSSVQIAKHLGIPEATLRRWRNGLSSSSDEDRVRMVNRNGTVYPMRTRAIGRIGAQPQKGKVKSLKKSLKKLENDLAEMKEKASPEVHHLLNVFTNWAFGISSSSDCLKALESIHRRVMLRS